jgi:hypothetical protein
LSVSVTAVWTAYHFLIVALSILLATPARLLTVGFFTLVRWIFVLILERFLDTLGVIMRVLLALTLSLLFCVFISASAKDKPNTTPPVTPVFGVVEAYYRPTLATELGVSWDRVIFAWNYFQPNNTNEFDTSAVADEYLNSDHQANRQVVGLIKGTPAWASPSGSVGAVPDNIDLPYDDPQNYYGAFVTRLVRHYSARGIHDWIIMNEPDVREGQGTVEFQGDVHDYYAMLKVAYQAAHAADPEAHIQIAGMTWWSDWTEGRMSYLYRLLGIISTDKHAAENNWYFDGISIHLYFTTSSIWRVIGAYRQMLIHFGLTHKEMWMDEYNASPRLDPLSPYDAPFKVNLDQQADFIVQASATALAAGVDRLAVYRLFDDHFEPFVPGQKESWGLVRYDDSLRPAFYAYQQVINRFAGSTNIQRFNVPEATVITFTFPDSTLYVMWNDTYSTGKFLIHGGGIDNSVSVFDSTGVATIEPLVSQAGFSLISVDVPPAKKIDMPWIVVSGPVRMVQLPGPLRTIWFQHNNEKPDQLN